MRFLASPDNPDEVYCGNRLGLPAGLRVQIFSLETECTYVHVWMENCTDRFCPTGSQHTEGKCPSLETGKVSQIPKYRHSHREPGSGSPVLQFSCPICPKGSENRPKRLHCCLLFHKICLQGRKENCEY